jgi:cytochrome d ubiquinol oxidase subunit II
MTAATEFVRPEFFATMLSRPIAWVLIVVNLGCILAIPLLLDRSSAASRQPVVAQLIRNTEGGAFFASCLLLVSSLATVATGMFPILLRSTLASDNDMTIQKAASGTLNLGQGLVFWLAAMVLAIVYFVVLLRSFRGKVNLSDGHGSH